MQLQGNDPEALRHSATGARIAGSAMVTMATRYQSLAGYYEFSAKKLAAEIQVLETRALNLVALGVVGHSPVFLKHQQDQADALRNEIAHRHSSLVRTLP